MNADENRTGHVFADLTDRAAVVTGASSGIGRAIAIELARAGAQVVVHCGNRTDLADQVQAEIIGFGGAAHVISADFCGLTSDAAEEVVAQAWELAPVDIWVNNAGVDLLTGENSELSYEDKLLALFEVDVSASVLLGREVGRRMQERGHGVILNIGWDQADRGMEGDSGELFSAAKNAIMGYTRSLAVSLAPQVRVNCIAPGWIQTAWGETASDYWQQRVRDETPLQRWGAPAEIATTARFLASDAASFISGQVINVNGGAVR